MLAGICRVVGSNSLQVVLFEATSVNQSAETVQLPAHLEAFNWPQKSLRLPVCVYTGNFENMNTKS